MLSPHFDSSGVLKPPGQREKVPCWLVVPKWLDCETSIAPCLRLGTSCGGGGGCELVAAGGSGNLGIEFNIGICDTQIVKLHLVQNSWANLPVHCGNSWGLSLVVARLAWDLLERQPDKVLMNARGQELQHAMVEEVNSQAEEKV